ncbi:MAG: tryptophan-rich sensory protein [Elainella sp. Prado103]|jgi:tryptophan-rich sensory protein|nr:tryptophan-rich sensory protein [Elainella sp. Prado103]
MFSLLNRTDHLGLFSNIVFFALLAFISNVITFALNWNSNSNTELQPVWAPPGWAIGGVWLVLLAALGAARWFTVMQEKNVREKKIRVSGSSWVTGLAVFCCLYPFWTLAFDSRVMGLIGNGLTLLLAGWVTVKVSQVSGWATVIVVVLVTWVIFATLLLIRLVQLNGWN